MGSLESSRTLIEESGRYQDQQAVRLPSIRGKILKLPRNPKSCDLTSLRNYVREHCHNPIAIDLFCGAGGLSLGLKRAGFDVILGVDENEYAIETHRAHFGGCSAQADLADPEAIEEITEALAGIEVSLVAGGPPCQPFSKPIRWRRKAGIDDGVTNIDARRELWGPFIHFVERLRPRAVLLENVPDLAMNADGIILRKIVESLIRLDYSVSATTLPAHHFGVPQYRQRLFLVAFADDVNFCWPEPYIKADGSKVTLRDAISDLPVVAPGWNSTPGPYAGPTTELQTALRAGMPGNHSFEVWDHVTRAVREDDAEAFRLMDSQTRYPDLPAHLKRYDDENFTDKYNRLNWDVPSRAITAHLSRDGYWYIHPDQHRTLTIREAARIQTFPDWFRFAGFPVSAFRQIGEAVAPLVAEGLGGAVLTALAASEGRNGPFCYPCVEPEFCPTESRTLA